MPGRDEIRAKRPLTRSPVEKTRSKTALRGPLDREFVTTLGTTSFDYVLPVGGLHAYAEAMRGVSFTVVGLVSALHLGRASPQGMTKDST